MWDIWVQNWYFFLPLGLFSVTSLAVALEKTILFLGHKDLSDQEFTRALAYLETGEWEKAGVFFKGRRGPLAQLFLYCEALDSDGMDDPSLKLASLAQQLLDGWKNRIYVFSHVANLATLTGLFGTVTGMMWSFSAIQASGSADPAVVAGGISQALVTTFAGLAVALPSLLFHGVFSSAVSRKADQMEVLASEFLSYFKHKRPLEGEE